MRSKLNVSLGVAILLIGAAVFVAGRLINDGSMGEDQVSHVTPAPEIPTTTPEISGLLVERKDSRVILQAVSFDAGAGWVLGEADEPIGTTSGPEVEIVMTAKTAIYRDTTQLHPVASNESLTIHQTVAEATLDDLAPPTMVTVWGRKSGDRVIAEILFYSNSLDIQKPKSSIIC